MSAKLAARKPLAVHELERRASLTIEDVDAFIADHEFPLAEGPNVTFVYRGEADDVLLHHWIFGLPSRKRFKRIPDTDLWFLVEALPPGSRIEYKFEIVTGADRALIRDPLNPHLAHDPFGANSVCHAEGYALPEWTKPDPEARRGIVQRHLFESKAFGDTRRVSVYLPALFRSTRRYPLMIAHDGTDYLRFSGLKAVLDNLIHRLEIPPMIVLLTDPVKRLTEYANDPRHAEFLAEELLPWAEEKYALVGGPSARCLLGASLGAVASFSTAYRYPDVFGRLFVQSGSFAFTDIGESQRGPVFEPIVEFINGYRAQPISITERMFVSCGMYESLIYENRSLVPILQQTGMSVRYVEARDGHNWENWRDRMREGLTWLFPGPLWMVYE